MNFGFDETLDKNIDFDSMIDFDHDDLFAQGEGEKVGNLVEMGMVGEGGADFNLDWMRDVPGMGSMEDLNIGGGSGANGTMGVCPKDTLEIDVDGMLMLEP